MHRFQLPCATAVKIASRPSVRSVAFCKPRMPCLVHRPGNFLASRTRAVRGRRIAVNGRRPSTACRGCRRCKGNHFSLQPLKFFHAVEDVNRIVCFSICHLLSLDLVGQFADGSFCQSGQICENVRHHVNWRARWNRRICWRGARGRGGHRETRGRGRNKVWRTGGRKASA